MMPLDSQRSLSMPSNIAIQILSEAQKGHDKEICGFISTHAIRGLKAYPISNVANAPKRHYQMDAKQHIAAFKNMRQAEETLLAIYHSHPTGPAHPSATDIKEANHPDTYTIIASMNIKGVLELHAFIIQEDRELKEINLVIEE